MISATVAGNLGKDAEVRQAGGQNVCSFNIASSSKVKGEDVTTWVRAQLWGKRGDSLAQYLTKGQSVCAAGTLTTREYEGKTYLELNVSDVKLMGKPGGAANSGGGSGGSRAAPKPVANSGYTNDADEDIPF